MSHLDVLGRVVTDEVDIMGGFAQMGRARHAVVAVGHVKTTGVAHVPVRKAFHRVGEGWGMLASSSVSSRGSTTVSS